MKEERKRIAKVLYRTKKYATWSPCSIVIPNDVIDVRRYVEEDLRSVGINFKELQIQKIEK